MEVSVVAVVVVQHKNHNGLGTGGLNNGTNASSQTGGNAGANPGSGGGGVGCVSGTNKEGAGGSGIVIIRFLKPTT
jgi:hypothetical protein